MTEASLEKKQSCQNSLHDRHLCFLMSEGLHYKHREAYKELVQEAQCRCQQCGRTAKRGDNLCMPVGL